MAKIEGDTKNLSEVFTGRRYELDSYQREYRWETRNIEELLADFEKSFFLSYKTGDTRQSVKNYKPYFLGTIVLSTQDGKDAIIDGQQRMTTLTLLLIYLNNFQKTQPPSNQVVQLNTLIYADHFGTMAFTIDVDERRDLLTALYNDTPYVGGSKSESVLNMQARYTDIERVFPDSLKNVLPVFIQWLMTNVDLVVITAPTPEDAYAIFESMNDRGLNLTPTEMLKGFLISKLYELDDATQKQADDLWRKRMQALKEQERDGDADFLRSWLRARYVKNRPDFEAVGARFHKWLRDHAEDNDIHLRSAVDFRNFLLQDFDLYSGQYLHIQKASKQLTDVLPEAFYNAYNSVTLQPAVMLAPVTPSDDPATIQKKVRLVGIYLDIFIVRRLVSFRSIDRRTIEDKLYSLIPKIRGLDTTALVKVLKAELSNQVEQLTGLQSYYLHQMNGPHVHYILARLTDYIDQQCGQSGDFVKYVNRTKTTDRFQIEHLWANKYDRFNTIFPTEQEFAAYRNRIGGLVLLPASVNQSVNDSPYAQKVTAYSQQNLLARSLTPTCYVNNPKFTQFVAQTALPFHEYPQTFTRGDLDARQALYLSLAQRVWSPDRMDAV